MNSSREFTKIDADATVIFNTVERGIYGDINSTGGLPDYRKVLSHYTIAFDQLESLRKDTDISLKSYRPVPKKPTSDPREIPFVLSTILGADEEDIIIKPETNEKGADNSHELLQKIDNHNQQLVDVVNDFSKLYEQIKQAREI